MGYATPGLLAGRVVSIELLNGDRQQEIFSCDNLVVVVVPFSIKNVYRLLGSFILHLLASHRVFALVDWL